MDYFKMVEDSWELSDAIHDYVKNAGRDVPFSELWEKILAPSPLVDQARTLGEEGVAKGRIFLNSPYGLQFRADHKDWIPFRHGPVDLSAEPLP